MQRSFSALLDMYDDRDTSECIDDDEHALLVYGHERSVILTPAKARRLHIPPKRNLYRASDAYQLNLPLDFEVLPQPRLCSL
jgi:hypothetical protein